MKKILLIAAFVVAVIVSLPIIGNKFIESALDEQIEMLKANGISLSSSETKSTYLQTHKHYEFLVSDADAVVELLSTFSSYEPSDISYASLNGTLIGVDFNYSNIPLSKALSVDAYPMALSEAVMSEIKEDDEHLHQFINAFFEKKGLLYHIDYDIAGASFSGYVKDIKEEYKAKNGAKVILTLERVNYSGKGDLVAPQELLSSIENMLLSVKDEKSDFLFRINNFKSDASFESQSIYFSSINLQKFELFFKVAEAENLEVNASEIGVNFSSNTSGAKGVFSSKSSLKSLLIKSDKIKVNASDMNYNVSLEGVDKDSFEEVRLLLSEIQTDNSLLLQQKVQESSVELLSKGLIFNIADLSLEKIVIDDVKDLEGFKIQSKVVIKEDADLKQKIANTPLLVLENIAMDTKIQFSKLIFDEITKNMPMAVLAKAYAKEERNTLVFDIKFKDSSLKVNDKPLSL